MEAKWSARFVPPDQSQHVHIEASSDRTSCFSRKKKKAETHKQATEDAMVTKQVDGGGVGELEHPQVHSVHA